jgi:hypothetical protein
VPGHLVAQLVSRQVKQSRRFEWALTADKSASLWAVTAHSRRFSRHARNKYSRMAEFGPEADRIPSWKGGTL